MRQEDAGDQERSGVISIDLPKRYTLQPRAACGAVPTFEAFPRAFLAYYEAVPHDLSPVSGSPDLGICFPKGWSRC